MKALIFALFLASTAAVADDARQLVQLPPAAQEALRQEMLDNLLAVNEILSLLAAGKVREAGDAAEGKLGRSGPRRSVGLTKRMSGTWGKTMRYAVPPGPVKSARSSASKARRISSAFVTACRAANGAT